MLLYILVGLAFLLGAGAVLGSFFGVTKLPAMMLQRKLDARLEEVASVPEAEPAAEGKPRGVLKVTEGGPMPALDRFIGGTTRGTALGRWIEQSGVKTTISAILLIAAGLAVALGVAGDAAAQGQMGLSGRGRPRRRAAVRVPEHEAHQADARVRGRIPGSAGPDRAGPSRPATPSSPA